VNFFLTIAVSGTVLLVIVAATDVWCLVTGRLTPGQVIQFWSREHPFYSGLLAAFVGAFAAHIFWHR